MNSDAEVPAGSARFAVFDTAIGACALVWRGHALIGALLPAASVSATKARVRRHFRGAEEATPTALVEQSIVRITGLLNGEADDLQDIELDMGAVPDFHRRVYEVARRIPPGSTRTYGEIATELQEPHAARAVGQALGANPFAPIVPCHRVLAAGGKSGGFSAPGGTRTKLRMLEIEGAPLGGSPGLFDR